MIAGFNLSSSKARGLLLVILVGASFIAVGLKRPAGVGLKRPALALPPRPCMIGGLSCPTLPLNLPMLSLASLPTASWRRKGANAEGAAAGEWEAKTESRDSSDPGESGIGEGR